MANTYFQFKQFTIQQQHCAMKVCTDACLFGAWVSEKITDSSIEQIIDIGAGTGLLSLMLAQNSLVSITAIEIQPLAAMQCNQNFAASSFHEQLHVACCDVLDYHPTGLADLIICNPPFFSGDLTSPNEASNIAKHDAGLSLAALAASCNRLSNDGGLVALLLPCLRANEMKLLMRDNHFYTVSEAIVKHTELHKPFRAMIIFDRKLPETVTKETIVIKDELQQYSPRYKALLHYYYLDL